RPVGAGVSPEAGALMLTTFVTRSMVSARPVSIGRVTAVMNRNTTVLRSGAAYWLVLLSGVVEPLLYLLSIGVGVGALIGEITVDGRAMPYAWFVGPAMLASSAMSGALSETTFNFFHKLKYAKTFDAVLATPTRPIEIALGELAWATVRGAFYSAVFLAVMVVMGMATPGRALAAFPAAVLVGVAFGALGMAVSAFLRGWQDFDLIAVGQFALFLFSGTFAPIEDYPSGVQIVIQIAPLWHGVELLRGLCLGGGGVALIGHVAYLVALTAAGIWI